MEEKNKNVIDLKEKIIDDFFNEIDVLKKNISQDISIDDTNNLTQQYKKNIAKIYSYFTKKYDIDDEYRLLIMKKIIVEDKTKDKLLLDTLIEDLGFNFGDIVLYLINKYTNDYFLGKLDLIKNYINHLDKIQLDELLIKSIKYDIGKDFNKYLVKLGADKNILNKKIRTNITFFKENKELFFNSPLSRTRARDRVLVKYLLEELGHPEKKIKNVIHITGSNGKGSTCHFLRGILEVNGYNVNTYTKPSMVDYSENYIINNKNITDEKYENLMWKVKEAYDKVILRNDYIEEIRQVNKSYEETDEYIFNPSVSFINCTMILAFSESNADFSIIEVRFGGLKDITNVFTERETIATVLTYIQYGIGSNDRLMPFYREDGTVEFSNRATAYHKAMLGKKNRPMIVANQTDDVLEEIRRVAKDEVGTYTVEYGREWFIENETKNSFIFKWKDKKIKINKSKTLLGDFQTKNIATALATLYTLQEQGKVKIDDGLIQKGINNNKIVGRIHKILKGNYVKYFKGYNVKIISGVIKLNEDGENNIINLINNDNNFSYVIYTSNDKTNLKKLNFLDKIKSIDKNKFKLVIYRTNTEVFEQVKEKVKESKIDYVLKMNLSSALLYVKNELNIKNISNIKNNKKTKKQTKSNIFILCESMVNFDGTIEFLS